MTAPSYDARDMEFEVHSPDGQHLVVAHATWSPSWTATSTADCSCGWSVHNLFGHLTREQAIAHVRAVSA